MAGLGVVLDPVSEDASNAQIDVNDRVNFAVVGEPDFSAPDLDPQWASSSDTEGSVLASTRHQNRKITLPVRAYGQTAAGLDAQVAKLQQKVGKIVREGGTLQVTVPSGEALVYDLLDANIAIPVRQRLVSNMVADTTLTFTAKPYGRGGELFPTVATTNKVTNPSFELDTNGWGAGQFNTPPSFGIVRQADSDPPGKYIGYVSCSGQNQGASARVALTAGHTYTVRVRVELIPGGGQVSVLIGQAFSPFTTTTIGALDPSESGQWTGFSLLYTAPATGNYDLTVRQNTTAAADFKINGAMVAESATLIDYFDGDSPSAQWAGTPHASASQLIAWTDTGTGLTHTETSLPALIFTEAGVPGDVPALGRLLVTEAQGADQWYLVYGVQSRHYDPAATAGLFYEAGALTSQGGATTVAFTGASGGSAINAPVSAAWRSVLSTKLSGGSHLSHVGGFRVFARVMAKATNVGQVKFGFEWSVGDLRHPARNDETFTIGRAGAGRWYVAPLGTVQIDEIQRGTQQWEGRVLATGQTPDQVYVDYLLLVPTEMTGELRAVPPTAAPSAFNYRDEFDQLIGSALTGLQAPIPTGASGIWQGGGDTNDFAIAAASGAGAVGHAAQRTAVSDAANTPRRAWLNGAVTTNTLASIDIYTSVLPAGIAWSAGLILRLDTASGRHLRVFISNSDTADGDALSYALFTNDTDNTIDSTYQPNQVPPAAIPDLEAGKWYTLRAFVDYSGRLFAWFGPRGTVLPLLLQTYDGRLAFDGPSSGWRNGVPGFFDLKTDAIAQNRQYGNFWSVNPPWDAAMFDSQSAEIREDAAIREDPTGTVWAPVSVFEGDYLRILPAGHEGRTSRVIVKACRNDPLSGPDVAIDDITAQLRVVPRYLELPE